MPGLLMMAGQKNRILNNYRLGVWIQSNLKARLSGSFALPKGYSSAGGVSGSGVIPSSLGS